jgi:tetratricopeptide (TPR) repeat protein
MHEEILAHIICLEDEERNFDKAIFLLQNLIREDPNCVEAYVHLAADHGILGKYSQAEGYARSALRVDPLSGRAKYYLACALRDEGRLDEAYIEMDQALILVRKAAVKGTGAEANWERFPLFGWNKHIEDDAINLRAYMLRRKVDKSFKDMGNRLQKILRSIGIGHR